MRRLSIFLLFCLFACKPEGPTQVVLRVRTREDVAPKLARLYVRISTPDGQTWREQKALPIDLDGLTWPIDLPVLPGPGKPDDGTFEAIIEGQDADGTRIVETRVITNFVPHHEKLLVMMLAPCGTSAPDGMCLAPDDCHGEACPSCHFETGQCGDTPVVAGASLPDLDPDANPGDGVLKAPDSADAGGGHRDGGGNGSDGGTDMDAGSDEDAGSDGDAGEGEDAGSSMDAGEGADGGAANDAATGLSDGGQVDAGEPDPQRCTLSVDEPNQPFGIRLVPYVDAVARPKVGSKAELDDTTRTLYDRWKALYIADEGCGGGVVYVKSDPDHPQATTSEAHGYAMLVLAFMAGHDPDARALFDGMVRYRRAHPSADSEHLMAIRQNALCKTEPYTGSSNEGDMDMAFALLLANKQWGSGAMDYYGDARRILRDILGRAALSEYFLLLGTRPLLVDSMPMSVFSPAYSLSFAIASGDSTWQVLGEHGYAYLQEMQNSYSPVPGLWPDYIVQPASESRRPASASELGSVWDGDYGPHASRAPLRIALHYLTSGDGKARLALERLNGWFSSLTHGDPLALRSAYSLSGAPLSEEFSMALMAPLGAAAMAGTSTDWSTVLWGALSKPPSTSSSYLDDTMQLLVTIVMGGNAWMPNAVLCPGDELTQELVLQPGSEGKDARVTSVSAHRASPNGGATDRVIASAWTWDGEPGVIRTFMDFDLSQVPSGALLQSATLTLFGELGEGSSSGHFQLSGSNELLVRRVASPWQEDTVTWNNQPSTEVNDQLELPASTSRTQDYVIDVTDFIQKRLTDPAHNFGIAIQLKTEERFRAVQFSSSDFAEALRRPRLELKYRVRATN